MKSIESDLLCDGVQFEILSQPSTFNVTRFMYAFLIYIRRHAYNYGIYLLYIHKHMLTDSSCIIIQYLVDGLRACGSAASCSKFLK